MVKLLDKILISLIILLIYSQFEAYSQSIYAPRYYPSNNQNDGRNDSIVNDTSFFEIPDTGKFKGMFINFDEVPLFPGGDKALISYLLTNAIYPQTAIDDRVEGKVVTRFTIDTDGSTGDFVLINSVRDDLDNECIRVIKEMPAWKPGSTLFRANKGYYISKVKTWYLIHLTFSLTNEDKPGIIIKPHPDSSYFNRWY